jgi:hypothetical protein
MLGSSVLRTTVSGGFRLLKPAKKKKKKKKIRVKK